MVKYPGGALIPLLHVDRREHGSIRIQLVCALRKMIVEVALSAGLRLPSSRILARDQGVSRTTAINVYEQLTSEGLIFSRVGAGAFVSEVLEKERPSIPALNDQEVGAIKPRVAELSQHASEQYFPRLSHPENPRAFITGIAAFDQFPMALWSKLNAQFWRKPRNAVLGYPDAAGLSELRRAVTVHLRANRGIVCDAEQVFIFNGAQDAFNRIGNMLLNPGDRVWFENPGPIGARNSLITSGAELVPVPIDDEGLDVAEGLRLSPEFRLAFVTPAHQHPLGVTMSLRRRFELLDAASQNGAWVLEDDYVGEFRYSGPPPPTLKSVDTTGRVIYVGTFSKSMFAALRLGYVVAPSELAPVFRRIAEATMQGAPTSLQSVMARFITEGHFTTHIRRMRRVYAERQTALTEAAAQYLGGLMTVNPTDTGFQMIGHLAQGLDEGELCARSAAQNILISPISRFAITPVKQRGVILGFSAVSPRNIEIGVKGLAAILRQMQAEQG
ncbi:MAG: MocR-like pyridoxine biosynthesis transcription factor PdxR [Rhodobacterales bacterium]